VVAAVDDDNNGDGAPVVELGPLWLLPAAAQCTGDGTRFNKVDIDAGE
jgi:hypothetical protein